MLGLRMFLPILLVAAAMGQQVQYNFDRDADFSKYQTYRWEEHPDSVDVDDLTKRQLGEAFNAELAKKGLTISQPDTADLVLVYQIAVRQEQEITAFDTGWGLGPGWRGGPRGPMVTATTNTFDVGSIALDFYDTSTKQLVWRGVITQALRERTNPNRRLRDMANAAQRLLRNYPPPTDR